MSFVPHFLRLQKSQWFDHKRLQRLQLKALRRVVHHAYSTVPFYRKLYNSAGVDPAALSSIEDMQKLPIISKEQLLAAPLKERFSRKYSDRDCYLKRTSGSTAQPVQILEEPHAMNVMRAYQLRRILSYGFKPWEKIAVIDPRRISKPKKGIAFRGFLSRILPGGGLYDVPMGSPTEILDAIMRLQPRGIWGLPSALRSLGDLLSGGDSRSLNLKAILSWGELLDNRTRKLVESQFRAPIYDGYGAVEVAPLGGLAWQCADRGFHINADCVILEFVKNGDAVSAGERGEVVATSLYRYAMPAVRYRLHDYAVPSDESCTCGRGLPLLEALEGRKIDCLIDENGELVSPFRVIIALEQIEIGRFQIIQPERNQLIVNLESASSITTETRTKLIEVCKSLVGMKTEVIMNTVPSIVEKNGLKFQPVVCKLSKPL